MHRALSFVFLLLVLFSADAQDVACSSADSIKVVKLLEKSKTLPESTDYILYFGGELMGTPYLPGTLDCEDKESLVVNLCGLDCTTFVETVMALSFTAKKKSAYFSDFAKALQSIRYRGGHLDGYLSRLHYFSDWIADNERRGNVKDLSKEYLSEKQTLKLDYMSQHYKNYRRLKNNLSSVKQIKETEHRLSGEKIYYLPKNKIGEESICTSIKKGSLIAITTNIKGLDIVHVGFAVFKDGRLHLLHASSQQGKVVLDGQPLDTYLKNKSTMTGIRVLSVCLQ